jgi:uncharacterized membrane-anchored protein
LATAGTLRALSAAHIRRSSDDDTGRYDHRCTRAAGDFPNVFKVRTKISAAVDRVLGSRDVRPLLVKVPQITVLFWATKVTSTAMGEAFADWLDGSSNLVVAGVGSVVAALALVAALRWQFRTTRYRTGVYWLAVAMVATFGTMAADSLHQFLGISYAYTTLFYALVLALVFWRWYANEGTLSIHSIDTRRREKFYWGTVLATFALGTATGDWTAGNLHLGFFPSAMLFLGVICVPLVAYSAGGNPIATFWFAYVVTRPLGASFADWFDYPKSLTGLGIQKIAVWGVLAVILVSLVAVIALRERATGTGSQLPSDRAAERVGEDQLVGSEQPS